MIQIERAVIDSALTRLLGCVPLWPLVFDPAIDVGVGAMSDWYGLARRTLWLASRREATLDAPGIVRPAEELLVVSLVRGQPHNYTSVLERDQPRGRFEAVRSAVERMNRDPDSVRSVNDLADLCGISVRSLQDGFRRYLGVTPSHYLRSVRSSSEREDEAPDG